MTDFAKLTFIRKHLQKEFAKKGIDIFANSRKSNLVKYRRACVYLLREQGYKYFEISSIMMINNRAMNNATIHYHYKLHIFERETYAESKNTEAMARQIFEIIEQAYKDKLR